MKSISLIPYKVGDQDYEVKKSLAGVLFVPGLNLSAREAVDHDRIARKIEECTSDEILLEDSDWQKIKRSVEVHTGFTRNDVEFVHRVLNAPEVDVEKKEY